MSRALAAALGLSPQAFQVGDDRLSVRCLKQALETAHARGARRAFEKAWVL